jgi:hypothetical protein
MPGCLTDECQKNKEHLLKQFPAGSLRSIGLPELELECIKPSRWLGCTGGSCANPSGGWLSKNGTSMDVVDMGSA